MITRTRVYVEKKTELCENSNIQQDCRKKIGTLLFTCHQLPWSAQMCI